MECPRCGFVQPEDRFCANCGLNIAAHAKKPKSLSQQILARPAFYGVLAIISGIILVQVVKKTATTVNEKSGLNAVETSPVANTTSAQQTPTQVAPTPPPAAAGTRAVPPPVESEVSGSELQASGLAAPTPTVAPGAIAAKTVTDTATAEGSSAGATAKPPPAQFELGFYEIGRESWVVLVNEGKTAGEQNGWRAISFATRERVQAALSAARRLPGQRQMNSQPSSAAMLHFPLAAATAQQAQPIGLFMDLAVVKLDPTQVEIDVASHLGLRSTDATTPELHQKADFTASFSPHGALVILGSLPRKALPEGSATAGTPLSVLDSPDFLEGQSEIIFVIQGR
ncbi:MAG: zinc ribbon domain-containing protein [Bdellovibrionales bacterium]